MEHESTTVDDIVKRHIKPTIANAVTTMMIDKKKPPQETISEEDDELLIKEDDLIKESDSPKPSRRLRKKSQNVVLLLGDHDEQDEEDEKYNEGDEDEEEEKKEEEEEEEEDPFDQENEKRIFNPPDQDSLEDEENVIAVPPAFFINILEKKTVKLKQTNQVKNLFKLQITPIEKAQKEIVNLKELLQEIKDIQWNEKYDEKGVASVFCAISDVEACVGKLVHFAHLPLANGNFKRKREDTTTLESNKKRKTEEPRQDNEEGEIPFNYRIEKYKDTITKKKLIDIFIFHYHPQDFTPSQILSDENEKIKIELIWNKKWIKSGKFGGANTKITCDFQHLAFVTQALDNYALKLEEYLESQPDVNEEMSDLLTKMKRQGMRNVKKYGVAGNIDPLEYSFFYRFKVYLIHIWKLWKDPEYAEFVSSAEEIKDNNKNKTLDEVRFIQVKEILKLHESICNDRYICISQVFDFFGLKNEQEKNYFKSLLQQFSDFKTYSAQPFSDISTDYPGNKHYVTRKIISNQNTLLVKLVHQGDDEKEDQFFLDKTWFDALKSGVAIMYHDLCLMNMSKKFSQISSEKEITDAFVIDQFKGLRWHMEFFKVTMGKTKSGTSLVKQIDRAWFIDKTAIPTTIKQSVVSQQRSNKKGQEPEEEEEKGDEC